MKIFTKDVSSIIKKFTKKLDAAHREAVQKSNEAAIMASRWTVEKNKHAEEADSAKRASDALKDLLGGVDE